MPLPKPFCEIQTNKDKIEGDNPMNEFNDDKIYAVVRNKTKNSKAVLSTLNGIEIGPGETVNLRMMFRKAQLADATQEIYNFIHHQILEEVTSPQDSNVVPANPAQPASEAVETETVEVKPKNASQIQSELQTKIREAKVRDSIVEISDCTLLSRLEDILTNPETLPEVRKAAKVQYMTLRGWVNEGQLIEGSVDDDNNDITSIDSWEFQPFSVAKATGESVIQ
jgi:hypothetical protein